MSQAPVDDSPTTLEAVENCGRTIKLDQADPGIYVVRHIGVDDEHAARLKQFGICEGRAIRVVTTGNPMILVVQNTRVGLSRVFASSIFATKQDAVCEGQA
tara:strand:- start:3524 stop:3826 length:303 start_codon:yes stop_codon:yes gene_type:complete